MRAWPTTVEVAPSILSADFGRVREQVEEVLDAGARVIHIDVMDGHFVPVITFGPKMVADIAGVIHDRGAFADVHLMIEQPERHISQFADAGADSITVHVETCPHLHYTLQQINELGCRAGLTLNPATPVEAISEAAQYADVLLCMSVNPGWGGQSFIPATLDRLPRIRELAAEGVAVEVDGGVATETAAGVYRAGANILVAGSAVFDSAKPGRGVRRARRGRRRRGRRRVALTDADRAHLARCLELAERGRRTAAPNPVVGAVVVRDGSVIGEGWHERPGALMPRSSRSAPPAMRPAPPSTRTWSPAAITGARRRARTRSSPRGREPRRRGDVRPDRQGRRRRDRAPARWPASSVDIAGGDAERRARRANAGWLTLSLLGRPHVTYKAAVSADGRTAAAGDGPRWISSDESRALVHEMRAQAGAVMVGSGTAIADDPLLTARDIDPPAERQPLRVVLDRRGRLPASSRLVETASPDAPVLVVRAPGAGGVSAPDVEVLTCADPVEALRGAGSSPDRVGAARGRRDGRHGPARPGPYSICEQAIKGCSHFAKLDLYKGYHQTNMDEESRKLTVYFTPWGYHQYTKMTMGTVGSAGHQQEQIDITLAGN